MLQLDDQTTLSGDPSEVPLDLLAVSITTAQTGSSEPGPSVSVDDVHQAETSHSYSSTSASNLSDIPLGAIEDLWEGAVIHLESLKVSADFIKSLRNATLDNPSIGLSEEAIYRLRNPNQSHPSALLIMTCTWQSSYIWAPIGVNYQAIAPLSYIVGPMQPYWLITELARWCGPNRNRVYGAPHVYQLMCHVHWSFLCSRVLSYCSEPRYDPLHLQWVVGTQRFPIKNSILSLSVHSYKHCIKNPGVLHSSITYISQASLTWIPWKGFICLKRPQGN